jgi:hypothetical protein
MAAPQVALIRLIPLAADLCSPWPCLQSCTTICQHHPQSVYYSKKINCISMAIEYIDTIHLRDLHLSTWRLSCQGSEAPREQGQWGVGGGNSGQDPARRRTYLIAVARSLQLHLIAKYNQLTALLIGCLPLRGPQIAQLATPSICCSPLPRVAPKSPNSVPVDLLLPTVPSCPQIAHLVVESICCSPLHRVATKSPSSLRRRFAAPCCAPNRLGLSLQSGWALRRERT